MTDLSDSSACECGHQLINHERKGDSYGRCCVQLGRTVDETRPFNHPERYRCPCDEFTPETASSRVRRMREATGLRRRRA